MHDAGHDAYAYAASGLKALLENVTNKAADLGYIGVEGIDIVSFKRATGRDLKDWQGEFNGLLSKIRSADGRHRTVLLRLFFAKCSNN